MEQWEALIEAYPSPVDLKYFSKAVQTAGVVLKQDLAPFEIEWVLHTLMHQPVKLLETVRSQHTQNKAIGDAFKLLSAICETVTEACEPYFEDIISLTELPLEPLVFRQALACTESVARVSAVGARNLKPLLRRLEHATSCKASLATAIGVICEHHPEVAQDCFNHIWRVYLNLLESDKTNVPSVLQGILGLFTHFGVDLPTAELGPFYRRLASDYIYAPRCKQVCLKILASHARIFRENLLSDSTLRSLLWEELQESTGNADLTSLVIKAVTEVYDTISARLDKKAIQKIAETELIKRLTSVRSHVKYTTQRILTRYEDKFKLNIGAKSYVDVHSLEFELREENVSYDVAEAVSYCIEANLENSDALLQSAMIFYRHLPANKRKDIVRGLLNAPSDLRMTATVFFISESTAEEGCIDEHLAFWKDLFDTNGGKDTVVVEKSSLVLEDFLNHTIFAIGNFLEEGNETIPPKLHRLLDLTSHVLSFQSNLLTSELCPVLLSQLIAVSKIYIAAAVVRAVRCAGVHTEPPHWGGVLKEACEIIRLESCDDEALVCEVCLLYLQSPAEVLHLDDLALALRLIFSRGDVESAVLSEALKKLETLIVTERESLDQSFIQTIIQRVDSIRSRKRMKGKDDRILNRDILLFLGKYGRQADTAPKDKISDVNLIKMVDTFALNLPNPDEGVSYKLHLTRILDVALRREDSETLQKLFTIITAQLTSKDDQNLQQVLIRVCAALCAAHTRGQTCDVRSIQDAFMYCDSPACVQLMAKYITEEISPGVRAMLCDGLEAVLLRDRDDTLVPFVCEHAAVLLTSCHATKKRAGINITESLLAALKQNNELCKENLPNIMKLIPKTNLSRANLVFRTATEIFMEKIELFTDNIVKDTIKILLEDLMRNQTENNFKTTPLVNIFKNITKVIVEFIKKVFEYKNWNDDELLAIIFKVLNEDTYEKTRLLYILSILKETHLFSTEICRQLLTNKNCMVSDMLFETNICVERDYFHMEADLKFLEQYSEVLLENRYEETLQCLADFIRKVTPECVKHERRSIEGCLSVYTQKQVPSRLQTAFEEWCTKLPLKIITTSIEKEQFTDEHSTIISALKILLKFFNLATLTDLAIIARKWPKILLKLYSSGYFAYIKPRMTFLTDLLTVSVKFMTVTDVKNLLSEGSQLKGLSDQKNGEDFCRFFMSVFFETLVKKPFVLLEVESCSALMNDVVKYSLKKKCNDEIYENILDLVVKIWPTYASQSSFKQKQALLLDLANYPRKLDATTEPMRWAVNVLKEGSVEEKARVVAVLPAGEGFSECYRTYASGLPVRLSEMEGQATVCFRALLDALVRTGDRTLLDIIINLAEGDDTKGWWDEALDSCMVSLASDADLPLLKTTLTRARDSPSLGVCCRLLLPLLRYSSSSLCESFYASNLKQLLKINTKIPTAMNRFREFVIDYIKTFKILELAFQKIPTSNIESPTSSLYSEVTPAQSWHLVKETCRLCQTMTKLKLLEGADDKLKEDFRLLKCAIYNCFCAAITCRKPVEAIYNYIFSGSVWDTLTHPHTHYRLPITPAWNQRTKLQPVSIGVEGTGSDLASLSLTHTLRTKMFVRTLSENPFVFDFTNELSQEEIKSQEVRLATNELNEHECAATLTALLCHVAATPMTEWRHKLVQALQPAHRNTKWLLAQIICNCKEELKTHAEFLSSDLLQVITTTAVESEGKKVLNGLHVDILETLIYWKVPIENPEHLNAYIELLLHTLLLHRKHTSLYRTLLTLLMKVLDAFGSLVTEIQFSIFEEYLKATDPYITKTIEILTKLLKAKVQIKQLVPTLTNQLETAQGNQLYTLAELFGLVLNVCDNKGPYLNRFAKLLDKLRNSSIGSYVKVLYYAQNGCPLCIDERNFRATMDYTNKLAGAEKSKCLDILTTYHQNEYIQEVFDAIDLPELILAENIKAFSLIKAGIKSMEDGVKRKLVTLVSSYAGHSVLKVRKAACEVVLAAFEDLLKTSDIPPHKKPRTSSTYLISSLTSNDVYVRTVVKAVSMCCLDKDSSISSMARTEIAKCMSKSIGLRFIEAFLLTVYLPTTLSTNTAISLSMCASVLLELLFAELKTQDRFKSLKLREEPLAERVTATGPPKLLTMASTYQGSLTLSSATVGRPRRKNIQGTTSNAPAIDVQITIEAILDTLLQFAKNIPEAAETFSIEIVKSIKTRFEFDNCIAQCLGEILERGPNVLTPFVVQMCDAFIDDICEIARVQNAVQILRTATKATDGEAIIKCLQLNLELKCAKEDVPFEIPIIEDDVVMQERMEFSVEDLTCIFGKLSDWDSLTVGEKRTIKNSGLPPLWTDAYNFKLQLESYNNSPSSDWFSRMVSAYKQEGREYTLKWLREVDKWPRRHFHISAVTEAIEWLSTDEDHDKYNIFDFHPSDCLAEWAARLMVRHAHNNKISTSSSEERRSRSTELWWCAIANEKGLGCLVLDCVDRNVCGTNGQTLFETEPLPWLTEKLAARREMVADTDTLEQLIDVAKNCYQEYGSLSHADDVLKLQRLILLLHQDTDGLTEEVTQESLKVIDEFSSNPEEIKHKDNIAGICEMALHYYDRNWPDDSESSFKEMLSIVSRVINSGITNIGFLAVLLNRMEYVAGKLDNDVASKLLDLIQLYNPDEFFLDHVRSYRKLFPSRLTNVYPNVWERDSDILSKHKKYLELVGDAEFGLLQYCVELLNALGTKDIEKWQSTFKRMKAKIFENPYAGSDYQLLNKYKNKLYEIEEYDPSSEKRLQEICRQLRKPPQCLLRLSQLCPALSVSRDCPGSLMGLRDSVAVVKFYDQVKVYTDSIRRPVVLKVLTSDGLTRRYLLKSGEPLQADAASQSLLKYAHALWKSLNTVPVQYSVVPLSEDSGLIEYLEDTERIRDLIKESCDLDGILASDASYHSARIRTPKDALRRAIAKRSLCTQDLIWKLRTAANTVATSSVFTWILGVGDRHLENILYRQQDGGTCHVDWGSVLGFTVSEPPARLTANLSAAHHRTELEAYLQRLLTSLRDSNKFFVAVLKISFKWMGRDFDEKLPYIESILQGTSRSVDVTRLAIADSNMAQPEKHKLLAPLDTVFADYPQKETYSVEEQVSTFLRHCTAPEILSNCRRAWEPWA